ncbi:MAG: phosphoribosylamine--glycine ligase [Actinomycetes bacterium]|nr:MAG: phosphoribosylamine--glycine ligase [Actinomycetota bacterium]
MKVLLVGSGGREHAIGWKLASSPRVRELVSLPGNPGLAGLGPVIEGIDPTDAGAVAAMAAAQGFDLVVVGPEAPLAAGVTDAISRYGIPVFGPTRAAAKLESSKSHAKDVMLRARVPTGWAVTVTDLDEARRHVESSDGPFVVKADGLAAGKGVLVTDSRADAVAWAERWLPSGPVVIEEYLEGPEVSVFAVCTDAGARPLEPARDHKRLGDGDTGPNTGGMGAYSPVSDLPEGLVDDVMRRVIEPTLALMAEDGTPFRGFLYAGLILTADGPKVLEFNVRLGDPETQTVLPRLANDLVDVLEGAEPEWSDVATVTVVLAARGYPESPETGAEIRGLDAVGDDALVFHAGTRREGGKVVVAGGRVLAVVGSGASIAGARERAYAAADRISWPGKVFRTDIGLRAD